MKHNPMKMKDHINQLDKILNSLHSKVLISACKILDKIIKAYRNVVL